MSEISIAEQVRAIIVERLNVKLEEVIDTARFKEDLGADSLDTVEVVLELEKKFNMSIPDTEAEKITTVGAAIKYIESIQK